MQCNSKGNEAGNLHVICFEWPRVYSHTHTCCDGSRANNSSDLMVFTGSDRKVSRNIEFTSCGDVIAPKQHNIKNKVITLSKIGVCTHGKISSV